MSKLRFNELMGKSIIKTLSVKGKKRGGTVQCWCLFLMVMMALQQPLGGPSWQEIEVSLSIWTQRPHCWHVSIVTSLPPLGLWTTGILLLPSGEVWGTVGGWAYGSHLISPFLPTCVLHGRLKSCYSQIAQNSSLQQVWQVGCAFEWESTDSGHKGSPSSTTTREAVGSLVALLSGDRSCNGKGMNLCFWKDRDLYIIYP